MALSLAAPLVAAQATRPSFSISIGAPKDIESDSVELSITITNISDHDVVLGSGGHTETDFTFQVKDSTGKAPPEAPYMKGLGPDFGNLSYSMLKPGESLKRALDLRKMFVLPPGKYSIQVSRFENAFAIYGSKNRAATDLGPGHKSEPVGPLYEPSPNSNLEIKSNTIRFTVVP
ncbi:MAG TPA: hypothetical protein VMB18_17605 [Terriglobales bacterium]|nr:hypothetical protein [Terriglobales bacterium]